MATGKEYTLAVRIAGVIDKTFTSSLAKANTSLKATFKTLDSDFTKLDKGFNTIMKEGKKCFDAIATAAGVAAMAIGAATAASIKVGSEFESAFTGVTKTVEATEEEYEKLRKSILEMTRDLPPTASEIAAVMETAGQLGIATESLTDFTEAMIKLGFSTKDLSADDAATALARFANIMQMDDYGKDGVSNFERLASTIVYLGNNYATTEGEIVSLAQQLAAAGQIAGMTEADIMGLSAAMMSVGLSPEIGSSSMSRLIMQMQEAVAGGGEELAKYADVAGTTADEFVTLFRGDAASALMLFIEGLGNAGEKAYGILDDLELSTIRTRKAFLSLAGAGDIGTKAIEDANRAWEENTALTTEAGKRIETVESQASIMKNAFQELGIAAYDELREPLLDVIHAITNGVHGLTEYVSGDNGISKWIKNIGQELPTLQRKVKQYGGKILDFFNPLLSIGKWFLQNPKVIVSAIAGIGTALATYKIASTITHIASALSSMSKGSLAISGIFAAIGLLTSAYTAYKQYEQGLVDQNLADHFGDIKLSMEELQAAAEYIISTDSLGAVKQALEEFEKLDSFKATMDAAIEEINKMNWKVYIGMQLTEDEKESYQQAIAEYVSAAQDYALQSQYAVSINMSVAFDENDLANSSVVDKVNQFYSDKYDELSAIGEKLNQAVTDAFTDGLLDIDEAKEIAELQAQMANVTASLATGEYEASLSLLQMEYAGGSIDSESFQNLLQEIQDQAEVASEQYKEAYAKNFASIQATYNAGYLSDDEYSSAMTGIKQEYLKNIAETNMKGINFAVETIMQQYSDELDPAIREYLQNVQDTIAEYSKNGELDWMDRQGILWMGMLEEIQDTPIEDKTTRKAISQLLTLLEPSEEELQSVLEQYRIAGGEIPEAIVEGMSQYNMLDAVVNENGEAALKVLGEQLVDSPYWDSFYGDLMGKFDQYNLYIPEQVSEGITSASAQLAADKVHAAADSTVDPAVSGLYEDTQSAIDNYYSQGFSANAEVGITLDPIFLTPKFSITSAVSEYVGSALSGASAALASGLSAIGHRESGGLATSPELTWFAENGPEMAIPIDGSANAISLWEQTGRLLGMSSVLDSVDLSGGGGPVIEYSPTLQFYGDAPSKEDIEDALRISQDEFEDLMARYQKTHGRVSFG